MAVKAMLQFCEIAENYKDLTAFLTGFLHFIYMACLPPNAADKKTERTA